MTSLAHDVQRVRSRSRRRATAAMLTSLSIATLGAGAMSLAVFTDSDAAAGGWSAGTIELGVDAGASFSAVGILPGDTGTKTITVENNGTGDLRYALVASATNDDGKALAAAIALEIRPGACPSAAAAVYAGDLGSATFGDPSQGADAGDRTVAAGASEDLCFSWSFPLTAGNAYQGAATTATFDFAAEQTANNP